MDRCLVNVDWIQSFNDFFVHYGPAGISDHAPMVVQYGSKRKSGMKPFRFSNMWTEHPRFLEVVKEAWTAEVRGNPPLLPKNEGLQRMLLRP